MTVESLLLVLVPSLAALGTLILGLGQQQHALSIVAVFVAMTSAIFTDWLKWFRLHPILANMAALVAVGYSFLRFSEGAPGTQLLSVAHLLIYLQVILLYQQKNLRIYWHICLLSLLQVVVAAALELGPQFGALLIVYMFFTLLTLTLLFVRGESLTHVALRRRSAEAHNALDRDDGKDVANNWSSQQAAISAAQVEISSRACSVATFENNMLNWQLLYRLIMLGVFTFLLTTGLFFLMPRFGSDHYGTGGERTERLVGFSPQLSLGEIGRVLESREVVMRVQFADDEGEPFNVLVDPYFRGNVLSKYIPHQGIWLDAGESFYVRASALGPAPEDQPIAIQTVLRETEGPLFSVSPAFAAPNTAPVGLRIDPHRLLLMQNDDQLSHGPRKYSIATTTFRNGIQRRQTPAARLSRMPGRMEPLLEYRQESFPKLTVLARQLVEDSEITDGDHQAITKLLEAHFKATGGYSYTLDQFSRPPRGVDPIEYFVSELRRGHCEYFASALVIMLRSLDIPARVVVGFHGGEYNRMGHFFLVRQLHAHAWVEAYITRQQLEEFSNFDQVPSRNGAWLRLDPTPGNGTNSVDVAQGGIFKRFSQIGDFLEVLWKDYVVGLDSTRQREAIYRPIAERTSSLKGALLNPDWWRVFANELRGRLGLDSIESFKQRWLTWKSVPLMAALFFGVLLVRRVWRRLSPVLRPWLAKRLRIRRQSWTKDPQLIWFRRLERYFAKRGLRRQPGQTHREFVAAASESLAGAEMTPGIAERGGRLVDGFYRVRFGKQCLSAAELQSLDQSVRQLESAISCFV